MLKVTSPHLQEPEDSLMELDVDSLMDSYRGCRHLRDATDVRLLQS